MEQSICIWLARVHMMFYKALCVIVLRYLYFPKVGKCLYLCIVECDATHFLLRHTCMLVYPEVVGCLYTSIAESHDIYLLMCIMYVIDL
jgi:hypothetical protein